MKKQISIGIFAAILLTSAFGCAWFYLSPTDGMTPKTAACDQGSPRIVHCVVSGNFLASFAHHFPVFSQLARGTVSQGIVLILLISLAWTARPSFDSSGMRDLLSFRALRVARESRRTNTMEHSLPFPMMRWLVFRRARDPWGALPARG